MRAWLLGIVLTALAGGLARQLAPRGREQAVVRLVSGLLLTLAILRPLAEWRWDGSGWDPGALERQAEEQAENFRKNQQDTLSAIIEERTEAYIWDKANQLGLRCTAEVTAEAGESGIPLPVSAVIRGPYDEALARCIEEEVGIPAEKLIWQEE